MSSVANEGTSRRRRNMRWLSPMVVGLVVLLMTGRAEAEPAVLYVDRENATCSDGGPATESEPLCTIGEGTDRAVAGDTVLVFGGTYSETVEVPNSGTSTAPIVVEAAPGETVTVQGGSSGFEVSSQSWVTIRGFHVVDTTSEGISLDGSSNITIEGNEVTGAGAPNSSDAAKGIELSATTNSTVIRNNVHHNSDAGIYLGSDSTGNLVASNTTSANAREYTRAAPGIFIRRANNNTVAANVSFDNEDAGINIWDADGNQVVNNLTYRNGDHGIDNLRSTNTVIVSNTVYDSADSGIEVVSSSAVTLANNISVDNGIDSTRTSGNIRVDSSSASSTTVDYDLVHLSTPGVMIDWAGSKYSSLAAFRSARGQEQHGLEADPKFKNVATGQFQLKAGSPAIDSANSSAPGQTDVDALGKARKDDPATANTGVGVRDFDDRGAFEFQPK
jgi:parallel beta-helix repeat protein